jgi:hypothetical protein
MRGSSQLGDRHRALRAGRAFADRCRLACVRALFLVCLAAACSPAARGGEEPAPRPNEVAIAPEPPAPVEEDVPDPAPSASAGDDPSIVCRQDRGPVPDPVRQPKPPGVKLGPQVTNHIPVEIVQRPVRARFACFRRCYQAGLVRDAKLAGRVSVKFVIEDGTGNVVSVEDAGSNLSDEAVVTCVIDEFKELHFPAPEGGDITVVYPIVFTPSP